jgi:hypothetical protein
MTLLLFIMIGAAGIVYLVSANDKNPRTQLLLIFVAAAGVGALVRGPSAAVVAVLLVGVWVMTRRLRQQWRRFLWRAVVITLAVADIFRPMVMRYLHDFGKLPAPSPASAQHWVGDSAATAVPPPR